MKLINLAKHDIATMHKSQINAFTYCCTGFHKTRIVLDHYNYHSIFFLRSVIFALK